MRLITKSGIAVFYSVVDHALVSKYTWRVVKTGNKYYAVTTLKSGKTVYMHRMITGVKRKAKLVVDHVNGCTVDNRRKNLRVVSYKVNAWNTRFVKDNVTTFPGVCMHKRTGKFQARMYVDGKRVSLGYYDTAKEAGKVYAKAHGLLQAEILRAA